MNDDFRELYATPFEIVLTMEGITPETGNTIQVWLFEIVLTWEGITPETGILYR